jgi:hypothetical protein
LLDEVRVRRDLPQLVEVDIRSDGEWKDLDSGVLDDVRFNDRLSQVVHATVRQHDNRLVGRRSTSRREQLDVGRLKTQ